MPMITECVTMVSFGRKNIMLHKDMLRVLCSIKQSTQLNSSLLKKVAGWLKEYST